MYSEPVTPEQVNHNTILLVKACQELGLNYDMQVRIYEYSQYTVHVLYMY